MDADRFDRLIITFGHWIPRRSVLRLLVALGLTGLGVRDVAAACLLNGKRCGGGRGTCCSGRCVRKRGTTRKSCRQARGQGICTIEDNVCVTGSSASCGGGFACICLVTSRGFSFCAQNAAFDSSNCTSDADCVNRPEGQAGDRCVQAGRRCCPGPDVDRMCVHKCPDPAQP